jgi:hypothetical protein
MKFSFLRLRRCHVDLGAAAAIEEFAAKEKQRYGDQDNENHQDGDDAGARSSTF